MAEMEKMMEVDGGMLSIHAEIFIQHLLSRVVLIVSEINFSYFISFIIQLSGRQGKEYYGPVSFLRHGKYTI
jgi:hypothetical protein